MRLLTILGIFFSLLFRMVAESWKKLVIPPAVTVSIGCLLAGLTGFNVLTTALVVGGVTVVVEAIVCAVAVVGLLSSP